MNKLFKILLGLVIIVVFVIIIGYLYIKTALPDIDLPENFEVKQTDELIQRGKYLANHVTVCMDCHSTRDWTKFSAPIISGTEGAGGDVFPEEAGFPGTFYAKNITPHALINWSDAEIFRAITSGVDREGEPLFPLMPYLSYSKMDIEDVSAIIAYLRSIPPVVSNIPNSEPSFPFSLIMRTIPPKPQQSNKPPKTDILAYGKYLTTIAACADCHTPQEKGQPIDEMFFAGGMEFPLPTGITIRSANITPDEDYGIGAWDKEDFIDRFKSYDIVDSTTIPAGGFNTVMPWTMYAGMTKEDLGAIYEFLKTVKPIKNRVIPF